MLHKSYCLITGYHFPRGPTATPLIPHSSSFPSSPLFLVLSLIFSKAPHLFPPSLLPPSILLLLLLIPPLLYLSLPSFVLVSSFLLDRLLSEMAAGSSVAQLGINKHLDFSLLSPSPVPLLFPFQFCAHTSTTQGFSFSIVICVLADPDHLSIRQKRAVYE